MGVLAERLKQQKEPEPTPTPSPAKTSGVLAQRFKERQGAEQSGGVLAQRFKERQLGRDYIAQDDDPATQGMTRVFSNIGGVAGAALEVLDRPRAAIVGAIGEATGDLPEGSGMKGLSGEKHYSFSELLPEMKGTSVSRGIDATLPLRERRDMGLEDVTKAPATEEEIDIRRGVGLLLDVVADPINLIGVGALTKSGKGAKLLSSSVKGLSTTHLDDVARTLGVSPKITDLAKNGNQWANSFIRGKVVKALAKENPQFLTLLTAKGYAPTSLSEIVAAAKQGAELAPTLAARVAAGQQKLVTWGGVGLPNAVETKIAQGMETGKRAFANSALGTGRFVNWTGWDDFDNALRAGEVEHARNKRLVVEAGTDMRQKIDALPQGAIPGSTVHQFERAGGAGIDDIADLARNTQKRQLAEMERRGIPIDEIQEAGYNYAPHITEEESVLNKMLGTFRGGKKPSTYTPHSRQRDIVWIEDPVTGNKVIDSLSRFAHEQGVKPESLKTWQASVDEINKAFGKKFFNEDLAEVTTIAALNNERALHGARQIDTFLDFGNRRLAEVGGVDAAIAKGWRPPTMAVPSRFVAKNGKTFRVNDRLQQLQNMPMEPAMRRMVENKWKLIAQPDESVKTLKALWGGYMGYWKRSTLFPFMEYHFRNVVGDLWNGWMNGWKARDIAGDLAQAKQIQQGMRGAVRTKAYGSIDNADIWRLAQDHGVVGSGQYGELVEEAMREVKRNKGGNLLKRELWDLETPVKIGSALEDNRRLGFFVRRLREGDSAEDAARTVANALYDYGDLTEWEKNLRRFAIPFYSWYRKNIPAQFKNLAKHPGKIAALPKIKGTIEGDYAVDPQNPQDNTAYESRTPDWMESSLPVRWRQTPDGKEEYFVLGNWIPSADLFRFMGDPQNAISNIMSNVNPPMKVATELLWKNQDFFRQRPIDMLRDPEAGLFEQGGPLRGNERTNYLGQNMATTTAKATELLPISRILSTLDRMNPGDMFGETRPYHDEVGTTEKLVKTMTGLKSYPVDTAKESAYDLMGMKRNGATPGLTEANVDKMLRKAIREGDLDSSMIYADILLGLLRREQEKLDAITRAK